MLYERNLIHSNSIYREQCKQQAAFSVKIHGMQHHGFDQQLWTEML